MKKKYTEPKIEIKKFASENIVTLSVLSSDTYKNALEGLTGENEAVDKSNIFSFTV